jgi:hypothetical protein
MRKNFLVPGFVCERCRHEWIGRQIRIGASRFLIEHEPTVCPRCKSPYWNQSRRVSRGKAELIRRNVPRPPKPEKPTIQ